MKKAVRISKRRQGRGLARTVGAFIIGATAGSVIALLFAPASGKYTRRQIGLRVRSLQRQATRQLKVTQRLLATQAEQLREAAAARVTNAKEWVAGHVANGHNRTSSRRAVRHA